MTPDELLAYALAGDGAPTDSERPTTARSLGGLTMREMQVLRLGALGRGNREIVAELVLRPKTVERHLSHILAKLGVSSRTGAARLAMQAGVA
jgi:DNA-binding NarL/FixJ family response regulator